MSTTADDAQKQNMSLRAAISNAYASVAAQQVTDSFSAITFEELCQEQIDRISGEDTSERLNELHRVQRTLIDLQAAVAQIKSLPASAFSKQDSTTDVNTDA